MDQDWLTPQARELAERVIAVGRKNGISPEAQRMMHIGAMGAGKTPALAVTLAQLDAAGVPFEESDNGHGTTTISTRPPGAESPEE